MNVKKIFEIFNRIFHKEDYFKTIEVGKIVWAKRYRSEEEKEKIEQGHREGPYLVIGKKKNKLYCLPCTSKENKELWEHLYYNMGKIKDEMEKSTIVRTNRIEELTPERYVWTMGSASPNDFNKINKKMYIVKNQTRNNNLKNKFIKYNLDIGDIIFYKNDLYYIKNITEKFYQCNQIHLCKNSRNPVNINGKIYSFNFEAYKNIKKKRNLKLIDICRETRIEGIKALNQKYVKTKETQNIIKRGNVIKAFGENYYVYGEFENNWLVHKIYRIQEDKKYIKVRINKSEFYIDLQGNKLIKSPNYEIVKMATEEEIEYIKNLKKSNKNKKSETEFEYYNKEIQPKSIIRNAQTLEDFYVIKREGNTITSVSSKDLYTKFEHDLNEQSPYYAVGRLSKIEYQNLQIQLNKVANENSNECNLTNKL